MPKPVILCVDDEKVILESLKIQIKQAFHDQYLYEAAESADEALEILEDLQGNDVPILVIVSDWLMPGMKGDEFLIKVHEQYPHIVKIMLTGQADESAIEKAINEANLFSCLSKPWDSSTLVNTIKSGLSE
ncbi:MAG: Hydrogenase transcriptional regulatory protein hupR1 [Chroococcopsis gigantea SAG 12.99]|jgi:CheY-like chemotaxis protein|nr:response regulator [Chlorogloea purpurea SAG 13.99]MDV2999069.1 Hydrogenase transcriptional regulatory protein hupR1 [Chroococcopsis gigantea SAG 12.99]